MKLSACFLLLAIATCAAQSDPARGRQPLVFILGNGSVTATGTRIFGVESASVGKHDETMEMARDLLKSCPEVSLTVDGDNPKIDYVLLLNRQEEHLMGDAVSQVMLLRTDKSVMFASKQGRVSKAVREGCKAILADWKDHKPASSSTTTPANASAKDHDKQWWQATNPPPK